MRPTWGYFWAMVASVFAIGASAGTDVVSNHQAVNQAILTASVIALAGLSLNQIWPRPLEIAVGLIRSRLPFRREDPLIPLSQAARELYEANLNGKIGDFARMDWGQGADPIKWCAYLMTGRDLPVYGRRTPSTILEIVPPDLFRSGALADGAQQIRRDGFDLWDDLLVKRSDVQAVMGGLRESDWRGA